MTPMLRPINEQETNEFPTASDPEPNELDRLYQGVDPTGSSEPIEFPVIDEPPMAEDDTLPMPDALKPQPTSGRRQCLDCGRETESGWYGAPMCPECKYDQTGDADYLKAEITSLRSLLDGATAALDLAYEGMKKLQDDLDFERSLNATRALLNPAPRTVIAEHAAQVTAAQYAERINAGWKVAAQWNDGAALHVMWVREVDTPAEQTRQTRLDEARAAGLPVAWERQQNRAGEAWESLICRPTLR